MRLLICAGGTGGGVYPAFAVHSALTNRLRDVDTLWVGSEDGMEQALVKRQGITMLSLGLMINELPEGAIWGVGGVGDHQLRMNAMAIVAGGGVRVGLEDNIWYDEDRTSLASNRDLVERVLEISAAMGRQPCPPKAARDLLGV